MSDNIWADLILSSEMIFGNESKCNVTYKIDTMLMSISAYESINKQFIENTNKFYNQNKELLNHLKMFYNLGMLQKFEYRELYYLLRRYDKKLDIKLINDFVKMIRANYNNFIEIENILGKLK